MPMYPYAAASVRYVLEIENGGSSYHIENAKNIGFANYINDVPQLFFTMDQDDPKVADLRGIVGVARVKLFRYEPGFSPYSPGGTPGITWQGWLMEADSNERDVVFYAYGFLAGLYFLHSDWNVQYKNVQVKTIVDDAWTRATTTLTNSPLAGFVKGTTQNPWADSAQTTELVVPQYGLFYKKLLYLMNEMAALGVGNTTNVVGFYISHHDNKFYFYADMGQDLNITYEYGGGQVAGFSDIHLPVYRRNDILAVGSAPNNVLLRTEVYDSADATTWGRLQESLYFPWVRDSGELTRVAGLRSVLSKRAQHVITLKFYPNAVRPTYVNDSSDTGGPWLGDRVLVRIDRGYSDVATQRYLLVGEKVLFVNGTEHVRYELQERPV